MKAVITVIIVCFLMMENLHCHAEMAIPAAKNRRLLSSDFTKNSAVDDEGDDAGSTQQNTHHKKEDISEPAKHPPHPWH